eukprot:2057837-Heterocapsa_arctica.AAC.1
MERNWVENLWGHKKKDICKWIRGKTGNGPLIVSNGGSAQMIDIMKVLKKHGAAYGQLMQRSYPNSVTKRCH